jgi:hypothetical protein
MFRLQEVIIRAFLEHEKLKLQWWSARRPIRIFLLYLAEFFLE